MATIGRVPEFDSTKEDFDTFLERFEQWIAANEIDSGKKANVFLSVLGPVEYGLLKSLVEPAKVIELSYQEISLTLSDHFKPKPILIAERFRFYQRNQSPGETISDYILALKRLVSLGQIRLWTCRRSLSQKVTVREGPYLQKSLRCCCCIRISAKRYQAAECSGSHKGLKCA